MGLSGKAVHFRTQGGPGIGWGHVIRCNALACALAQRGWTVSFELDRSDRTLRRRLGGEFRLLRRAPREARWVVFDSYDLHLADQREIRERGHLLLCIDDLENRPIEAEVVLNQNMGAREAAYRRAPARRLLLGPRYALLRAPFVRALPKRVAKRARNILGIFGGMDPGGLGRRVEEAVPASVEFRALSGASAEEVAEAMRWADVAVSAAGSTCWELSRLGVPALLIGCSEEQRVRAARLQKWGSAVNLGAPDRVTSGRLRSILGSLLEDWPRRRRMSLAARRLVDGKGAQRVAEVMTCWTMS